LSTFLRAFDQHMLADAVRQDQRCPGFVVTSWQVDRLSDKGVENPDGLFRFSGTGYDPVQGEAERTWTVVLKTLKTPSEQGEITDVWYWKRELLVVRSGILDDLPAPGLKAPRFYGTVEHKDGASIWMEYIHEKDPPRWQPHRFPAAAYHLGCFNGAYLAGRSLPHFPWLSRDQGIQWAKDWDPNGAWDHPSIQQVISGENLSRLKRLWANREQLFTAYHALPEVFSHCDTGRRNHIFRVDPNGAEEMVTIDWAYCGIAPLGWDLAVLLVDSALMFEMDPDELPGMEGKAIPMYIEGLRSVGWQGDSSLVRLGFCLSATLYALIPMPRAAVYWSEDWMQSSTLQAFSRPFEEIALGWRTVTEHLLDVGEEALSLR
jgi:hypothetical protein